MESLSLESSSIVPICICISVFTVYIPAFLMAGVMFGTSKDNIETTNLDVRGNFYRICHSRKFYNGSHVFYI